MSKKLDAERQQILPMASGKVLELGMGTGANFAFYPTDDPSLQVYGLEPELPLIARAQTNAKQYPQLNVSFVLGDARNMPIANESMDTVLCCLVLCTVPNPERVIQEAKRVLKPNGRLLVFEHVAAEQGSRLAAWQNRLNSVWSKLACGCNLNRQTRTIIESAGFTFTEIKDQRVPHYPAIVSPVIMGVAVKT
ncbi:MAG: class I SAM-dependent methyltransferase [Pontibacterium sp.]